MMNIISWTTGEELITVVLPRKKHRPDCYTAEGDAQYIISPGAVDMGSSRLARKTSAVSRPMSS